MSNSANTPVLPQGAGYGVGQSSYSPSAIDPLIANRLLVVQSRRYVVSINLLCNNLTRHSGIGLFFSAFMVVLTAVQARYTGFSPKSAEEFNSASRSVKPGLIASGIVSAWTCAATLVCQCAFHWNHR